MLCPIGFALSVPSAPLRNGIFLLKHRQMLLHKFCNTRDIGGVDATSRRSREASINGADGVVEGNPIYALAEPNEAEQKALSHAIAKAKENASMMARKVE
jgi:hypothetical protein